MRCDICGTEIKVGELMDVLIVNVVRDEANIYLGTEKTERKYVHHACDSVGRAGGTPGARTEGK